MMDIDIHSFAEAPHLYNRRPPPLGLWERLRLAWEVIRGRHPVHVEEEPPLPVVESISVNVADGIDSIHEAVYQFRLDGYDQPELLLLPAALYTALPRILREQGVSLQITHTSDGYLVFMGIPCRPASFTDTVLALGNQSDEMRRL
jgi:hypothetical protein